MEKDAGKGEEGGGEGKVLILNDNVQKLRHFDLGERKCPEIGEGLSEWLANLLLETR